MTPRPTNTPSQRKKCATCKQTFPVDCFRSNGLDTKGRQRIRGSCKVCDDVRRKLARDEGRAWLLDHKKNLSCTSCGMKDHRVIEFHHTDPSNKTATVARLLSRGKGSERIKREVNKCIPLCANCHRIFHYEEKRR